MPIEVKHPFVHPLPDENNPNEVGPDDWNANHAITMATGNLLGRQSAGAGPVEEIPISSITQFAGAFASQAEAEAGASNLVYMSPLRARQGEIAWAKARGQLNALDFGIDNTGATDCSAAILSLLTFASGNEIYFPKGIYRLNSPVVFSGEVNIRGAGNGAGPGLFTFGSSTVFRATFNNSSMFQFTTLYPCQLREFMCENVPNTSTSGAAIALLGPPTSAGSGNQAKSVVDRVSINGFHIGIYVFRPNYPVIHHCYFQNWRQDGLLMETDSTREGSCGFINNNYFFGDGTINQRSAMTLRCGYGIVSENEILGGQVGVNVSITSYPAGFVKIIDNTIENQYYYGIRLQAEDSSDASMWDISGNEFSNPSFPANYLSSIFVGDDAARVWLSDLIISRNIMRHAGNPSLGYIRCAAGQNILIRDNLLENISGGTQTLGIGVVGVANSVSLAGSPAPRVLDNQFRGAFTNRYSLSSTVPSLLRDHEPITFANVPANCAAGSQIMVSDGKATNFLGGNTILTSGGTSGGGPAFRTTASTWHSFTPS